MKNRRSLFLIFGLPLLLVAATAGVYIVARLRATPLAGLPIGPKIEESYAVLVGPPVALADGSDYLLLREIGASDSPLSLFAVDEGGSQLVEADYWNWDMDCVGFYSISGMARSGSDEFLVKSYCHDNERHEVDLLNPFRNSIARLGEFSLVASVLRAYDDSYYALAKPLYGECLSVLKSEGGVWWDVVSKISPPASVKNSQSCHFDESLSGFLGADVHGRIYVAQGQTLWTIEGSGSLARYDLPLDETFGLAVSVDGKVRVSGRQGGRSGIWGIGADLQTTRLEVPGEFGELSLSSDGRGMLTGQSTGKGMQAVQIPIQ